MYTVVYVHAKSNKQPLDNRSQRRECQSLFKLRPKSGGKCWLIFPLYTGLDVQIHTDTLSGWNNAAPSFEKSTQGLKTPGCIIIAPTITRWWISSYGDICFLTLMLLFFSLLSTRLRPSSPGGSAPTGPALFHWNEQCCFWLKWKNL